MVYLFPGKWMVLVEGNDVKPYPVSEFAIAPGETYDLLLKIQKNQPYIIYAESRDTLGAALGALMTEPHQVIPFEQVKPFPKPANVSEEMMSMMHHPMHLHGHWFILRNGQGEYDPLLHTIDVPPGATITADVDTDASGQWFFHCHMLYHLSCLQMM